MAERAHVTQDETVHSKGRVEALSDGVFAVALTLLTFDLVAAAKGVDPEEGLFEHLLNEWPTMVAYLVGFLTVLVCWINHRYVFTFVRRTDAGLLWVNGLQLALVAAVPLPTAILASYALEPQARDALLFYGATFFLMALSFWVLSTYVDSRRLADTDVDPLRYRGLRAIYAVAVVWTILCLIAAYFSVIPALVMWAFMFVVFAFPREFAGAVTRRMSRT